MCCSIGTAGVDVLGDALDRERLRANVWRDESKKLFDMLSECDRKLVFSNTRAEELKESLEREKQCAKDMNSRNEALVAELDAQLESLRRQVAQIKQSRSY